MSAARRRVTGTRYTTFVQQEPRGSSTLRVGRPDNGLRDDSLNPSKSSKTSPAVRTRKGKAAAENRFDARARAEIDFVVFECCRDRPGLPDFATSRPISEARAAVLRIYAEIKGGKEGTDKLL